VTTEDKSVKSLYISSGVNGSLLVTSLNLPDDPDKDPNNKAKIRVLQVSNRRTLFELFCKDVKHVLQ
jgi:hypothetical protein